MFVVFFVLALVFRLALALQSGMFNRLTRTEMEAIALNVAGYGGYDLYGGTTAYCTPVFSLYLAGLFHHFRNGIAGPIRESHDNLRRLRSALWALAAVRD